MPQKFMPLSLAQRILENKRRAKNRQVVVKSSNDTRSLEASYRNKLFEIISTITEDVMNTIPQLLKSYEKEYISDNYAETINNVMASVIGRHRDITEIAKLYASEMVNGVDINQRKAFHKGMKKALGVDLVGGIDNEGLTPVIQARIAENVSLIQSIPDEYFKKLVTIVNEGMMYGKSQGGIQGEILKLGKSTKERARLIARDQTQKANSTITQARQQSLGVTKYRWRTVGDESVRPTHRDNNGKVFRWDSPPKDTGHPGHDIQCRCVAEPIIDLDEL